MILAIYGAGGLGREVLDTALAVNHVSGKWTDIIFVDDVKTEEKINGAKRYSFAEFQNAFSTNEAKFVVAQGEPRSREALWNKIKQAGYQLEMLIHPNADVSQYAALGEGCIICAFAHVSCNVQLEENVYVQLHAVLGHDCTIGKHSCIGPGAMIAGTCRVGRQTYIGLSASIKEKTQVGSNTIVGMASVVTQELPDNVVAKGSPARAFRENIDGIIFK